MPPPVSDVVEIQQLIHRFSNSFDLKDWPRLEQCLASEIDTDYGDLRGTPPERMDASRYVGLRQAALEELKTHHLCGNHEITVANREATCRTSMTIDRFDPRNQERFTTHCHYLFSLQKTGDGWKISGIIQKILWNEGNPSIHAGLR